jgi:hypothetical protein
MNQKKEWDRAYKADPISVSSLVQELLKQLILDVVPSSEAVTQLHEFDGTHVMLGSFEAPEPLVADQADSIETFLGMAHWYSVPCLEGSPETANHDTTCMASETLAAVVNEVKAMTAATNLLPSQRLTKAAMRKQNASMTNISWKILSNIGM